MLFDHMYTPICVSSCWCPSFSLFRSGVWRITICSSITEFQSVRLMLLTTTFIWQNIARWVTFGSRLLLDWFGCSLTFKRVQRFSHGSQHFINSRIECLFDIMEPGNLFSSIGLYLDFCSGRFLLIWKPNNGREYWQFLYMFERVQSQ